MYFIVFICGNVCTTLPDIVLYSIDDTTVNLFKAEQHFDIQYISVSGTSQ